ncbi:glutathione peroxidase [Paenibacillus terrae HPL-003]|uniref:Glutathione peroxidase homolog BsaA n=1 Tax=Paenibacillus terrae (strain HPL-003) TaxID=985665 RepID=G7VRD7_PAETH|nr:glutathione peroxidase [Paenibacillus terrae HPL-003]
MILGFSCNQFADQEPDSNDSVHTFCTLNYGVAFPMFQKVDVRDKQAHPLFTYLASSLPFEGFDETHSVAKILIPLIHELHPEYLAEDFDQMEFHKIPD